MAERLAFGPSTQALLDEAASRDIPYMRLDRYSLVQLGQGVHQQRIRATMTSRTSGIAVDIASDKKLTNRLLDSAGLPVPRSEVVETEDEAVAAAGRLGYPCVLKPLDGNHGRGVALDLRDEAARPRRLPGGAPPEPVPRRDRRDLHHRARLPLPGDRRQAGGGRGARARPASAATARRPSASWSRSTNADPRRGIGHEKVLTRIRLDDNAVEVLAGQGFATGRRPARGRVRQARADRQHVDRRHLDRPDDGGPPGQRRDRRDGGARGRARHRRASTSSAPTSRCPCARPAAASSRSTRRPGSGCTRTPPRASRSTSPSRSSTCCSRPARRRGSRSSPSPAPTARRRPSGWSPTSSS